MRQFDAGEGCTVNPITPGAATHNHNNVSRTHVSRVETTRGEANGATVDQWIGGIAGIEQHCTANSRNTEFISVVTNPGDHPAGDPARMQHACRWWRCVGHAETEHVNIGNRACRNPQHIADDTTHTGIRAAERFEGAGMVVGLDLVRNLVTIPKGQNAGVINKGTQHPFILTPREHLLGCPHQKGADEAIDGAVAGSKSGKHRIVLAINRQIFGWLRILDAGFECLMGTVFTPGLGNRLKFTIGRITALGNKIGLNRPHLDQIKRQHTALTNCHQLIIISSTERNHRHVRGSGMWLSDQQCIKSSPRCRLVTGMVGNSGLDNINREIRRCLSGIGRCR